MNKLFEVLKSAPHGNRNAAGPHKKRIGESVSHPEHGHGVILDHDTHRANVKFAGREHDLIVPLKELQAPSFKVGTKVTHAKYGAGTVTQHIDAEHVGVSYDNPVQQLLGSAPTRQRELKLR